MARQLPFPVPVEPLDLETITYGFKKLSKCDTLSIVQGDETDTYLIEAPPATLEVMLKRKKAAVKGVHVI